MREYQVGNIYMPGIRVPFKRFKHFEINLIFVNSGRRRPSLVDIEFKRIKEEDQAKEQDSEK